MWRKRLTARGTDGLLVCTGKDGRIDTKPHGHGDVHTLLLQHGCVDAWSAAGLAHPAGTAPRAVVWCSPGLPACMRADVREGGAQG